MEHMMKKTNRKAGFVMSMELMLVASVLVIGAIAGLSVLQGAVNEEMTDLGNAVNAMDLGSLLNTNYVSSSSSFSLSFDAGIPGELPLP